MMMPTPFTYILETKSGEFYCGKSKDVWKRAKQHEKEKYPSWFNKDSRRRFDVVAIFYGDFEHQIKRAGVRMIATLIKNKKVLAS